MDEIRLFKLVGSVWVGLLGMVCILGHLLAGPNPISLTLGSAFMALALVALASLYLEGGEDGE
ncbi:MAG: hypothetical protein A2600_13755 [Candidatus Lambdaproteobacteria bacterium RIFOXYD1_FULL_56_27]|uniref:Uncharacterized protein n=1 Tax=Candidatus Lambdaproteobacteria bacterium RIFOXYD2_FULL_56_26 TaxID=1817773 RepID=A0A1F6GLM2_9PROT|nr:MAG: hypothetical protein A2557_00605 [Candidatus Lambdaproteobacteria bacterium RIFOXYD2_FULL_56_26]OGH01555.1 MAG: hypothetical protein A2426_11315 [Candidatus Lambdaproteobacteria bacterium RIFOXYC1_FULL_56_13]OGH08819.1 MAG: hypothetical protein A2600_13755 [Candidatus Lambdaproteobacteria bacterium RIFOXYD1_FULL_56_27]